MDCFVPVDPHRMRPICERLRQRTFGAKVVNPARKFSTCTAELLGAYIENATTRGYDPCWRTAAGEVLLDFCEYLPNLIRISRVTRRSGRLRIRVEDFNVARGIPLVLVVDRRVDGG